MSDRPLEATCEGNEENSQTCSTGKVRKGRARRNGSLLPLNRNTWTGTRFDENAGSQREHQNKSEHAHKHTKSIQRMKGMQVISSHSLPVINQENSASSVDN